MHSSEPVEDRPTPPCGPRRAGRGSLSRADCTVSTPRCDLHSRDVPTCQRSRPRGIGRQCRLGHEQAGGYIVCGLEDCPGQPAGEGGSDASTRLLRPRPSLSYSVMWHTLGTALSHREHTTQHCLQRESLPALKTQLWKVQGPVGPFHTHNCPRIKGW